MEPQDIYRVGVVNKTIAEKGMMKNPKFVKFYRMFSLTLGVYFLGQIADSLTGLYEKFPFINALVIFFLAVMVPYCAVLGFKSMKKQDAVVADVSKNQQ